MRVSKARKACVTAMMKDTIFEAASSVLERHGTNGLTMDRVATQVGVATGSLYNYFHDKNELLQFCYDRLVKPAFHAMEQIANDTETSATQKLERILLTAWEYSVENKGLLQLMAGADQGGQIKREVRPRFLKLLSGVFEQGIREGSFRPHNHAHTGRMFHGCLSELFELQAEGASPEVVNEYVQVLIGAATKGFSIHTDKGSKSDKADS